MDVSYYILSIYYTLHYPTDYEYESYDGWYNNPAHPEWGGADMPMERKTPIAYPDGVYEFAGRDRPNVLIISNLTQNGLTGRGSSTRTAFFIFFGKIIFQRPSHFYDSLQDNKLLKKY